MAVRVIVLVLCLVAVSEITGKTLPSYLKSCKRDEPELNECLKRLIENLRPYIGKGIAEMHISPLDPMTVPSVSLNQGSNSVNFKALFTDLKVYGAKNYQVKNVNVNIKNQSLDLELKLPLFKIESKYEVNGKILVLPIQGKGKFVGNFTDVQAKSKFKLNIFEKKNKKSFLEIKENKVNLTFGTVKLHFSNLFNGNKELGDQTNRFINDNWKELVQETRPLIEDTVAAIVIGIFKPVFETYSMDDLLPV